ncbi:MAG: NAD-dependent epimerase/dehydratase family protein [Salinivirgaceae bacterium]|nr:NAD-dependent epimerase/dehydratase family protein [Salinivirgaceae bacterium]MBQ4230784.1 NAD-dependent epimerase/dehydratase family protein [Salinivirgaceae bacterium]MBR2194155.1 NAD-dependent epimerase/dehydratase family protein [Salinivirgaceae bacterium]MBR3567948.1 NAD-dependent epimerase/dehydratase family protein [Salinivirgaceae bacterium]
MNKILVTGGAGFIGSALAEKLISNPDNYVVIVDNLSTGNIGKLPNLPKTNWRFIKCDVNDYTEIAPVMTTYQFDYVFHFAAVVGVLRTQQYPVSVLRDIDGIKNVLSLSKNTTVKRVFFSSSSEIYGDPVEMPQNVYTTPLNSRLPYAVVKNIGEAFLRSYKQEYDLDYTIFRFFNTYGPKQSRDFVISKFMLAALNNRDITIYGDGLQTRTFCYIDDNIDTCLTAFYENKVVNGVINIGGNREVTIKELAEIIIRETGSKSKIVHVDPLKEGDMRRRQPDNSDMKALLNRPLIKVDEGIRKIIEKGLFELNIQ